LVDGDWEFGLDEVQGGEVWEGVVAFDDDGYECDEEWSCEVVIGYQGGR